MPNRRRVPPSRGAQIIESLRALSRCLVEVILGLDPITAPRTPAVGKIRGNFEHLRPMRRHRDWGPGTLKRKGNRLRFLTTVELTFVGRYLLAQEQISEFDELTESLHPLGERPIDARLCRTGRRVTDAKCEFHATTRKMIDSHRSLRKGHGASKVQTRDECPDPNLGSN